MPLNAVNLGTIKERAEAVQSTPTPALTDPLSKPKERLMPQCIPSPESAYRPNQKELGVLRRRMVAHGWSRETVQLIARHCQEGTDPDFARFLIDHWVYRKGQR